MRGEKVEVGHRLIRPRNQPVDLVRLGTEQCVVSREFVWCRYPTGVGAKNSRGVSVTPTGHWKTSGNTSDTWYYVARRTNPEYFGGFPFLRLVGPKNSDGAETYALHGPITAQLIRGYVSHGCARMRSQDIIRLFWIVKQFASTPVTIQKEVERDANGKKVDVGVAAALFPADGSITFGASVGPRPF